MGRFFRQSTRAAAVPSGLPKPEDLDCFFEIAHWHDHWLAVRRTMLPLWSYRLVEWFDQHTACRRNANRKHVPVDQPQYDAAICSMMRLYNVAA
jgi:hypothetical protein